MHLTREIRKKPFKERCGKCLKFYGLYIIIPLFLQTSMYGIYIINREGQTNSNTFKALYVSCLSGISSLQNECIYV